MQNNLLTIEEIISRCKKSGTFLGHGDPKVHLAYLTKIRLLPQTIRRKIGDRIVGCYPEYVLPLLNKIEELRAKGLTYSQVRFQIAQPQTKWENPTNSHLPTQFLPASLSSPTSNGLAFLLIGLILGYLLATHNGGGSLSVTKPTLAAALPAESSSQPIAKVIGSDNSSSDPIYLIAIPQQNLYKLGKKDINLLK